MCKAIMASSVAARTLTDPRISPIGADLPVLNLSNLFNLRMIWFFVAPWLCGIQKEDLDSRPRLGRGQALRENDIVNIGVYPRSSAVPHSLKAVCTLLREPAQRFAEQAAHPTPEESASHVFSLCPLCQNQIVRAR
jgi:hypothetical protein